jgi:hypothetical protein
MILGRKGEKQAGPRAAGPEHAKHDADAPARDQLLAFTFVSCAVRDLTIDDDDDDDEIERQEKDRLVTSTIVPWKAKQKGENYWRADGSCRDRACMHAWVCECLKLKQLQLVVVVKEDLIVSGLAVRSHQRGWRATY